jgi:hypothetical protein
VSDFEHDITKIIQPSSLVSLISHQITCQHSKTCEQGPSKKHQTWSLYTSGPLFEGYSVQFNQ